MFLPHVYISLILNDSREQTRIGYTTFIRIFTNQATISITLPSPGDLGPLSLELSATLYQ